MTYQLKNIDEEFKTLALDPMELLEQLGTEDALDVFLRQPTTNDSLLPIWKNIHSTMRAMFDSALTQPDVSLWNFLYLLINEKAYSILKDHISPYGEFLPITVDGKKMFIFNCLDYAKEDQDQCLREYIDGIECGLKLLTFDTTDTKDKLLFKSKLEGGSLLFASDHFKQICERHELKGLRYDEDLLSIF